MDSFNGFTSNGSPIEIPANFFSDLLVEIEDLHALKILLYAFQLASSSEEQVVYFFPSKLSEAHFSGEEAPFQQGLALAIKQNWLLNIEVEIDGTQREICLLNTPKNAAALKAIQQGKIKLTKDGTESSSSRPDIFSLYEQNIGPLTPIIADTLKDLEDTYSPDWIHKAIQTAVKNNARSLRYIEVVLQNWQEEGTNERTDRRRRKKTTEEYDSDGRPDGEFSDFFDN